MTEVAEVDGEVLDGIGELANMILGNFKESIETQTGPLALTVPTVVYGKNFQTRTPVLASWTIVPFKVEDNFRSSRLHQTDGVRVTLSGSSADLR